MNIAGNCPEDSQLASGPFLSVSPYSTAPDSLGDIYHADADVVGLRFSLSGNQKSYTVYDTFYDSFYSCDGLYFEQNTIVLTFLLHTLDSDHPPTSKLNRLFPHVRMPVTWTFSCCVLHV